MTINTTQLRANLYQVLDEILETQKPVEIIRKGRKLKIILIQENQSKLENLQPHPGTICGNANDLIHLDWSTQWKKGKDL